MTTDNNLTELLKQFEELAIEAAKGDYFDTLEFFKSTPSILLALQKSLTLNKKQAEGIKLSTEYRTGNPAYEQLVALAAQHGVK
jgi:hypothetical protein